MAKKHPDDFDLSLTGSQIMTSHSSKALTKRSSSVASSDGHQGKAQSRHDPGGGVHESGPHGSDTKRLAPGGSGLALSGDGVHGNGAPAAAHGMPAQPVHASRAEGGARAKAKRNLSSDFLAFFDDTASGSKPKIKDKNKVHGSAGKKGLWSDESQSRTAFAGANPAPSTASSAKKSNSASSWYSHSVFRPDSSLSGSAVDVDGSVPGTPVATGSTGSVTPRASPATTPRYASGEDGVRNNELDPIAAAAAARVSRLLAQAGESVIVNSTRTSCNGATAPPSLRASTASQKALNAANNMTRGAVGTNGRGDGSVKPAPRLLLSDMENSYVNITHNKTPVNEMRFAAASAVVAAVPRSAAASVSKDAAEDYIRSVNAAASRIQHWYRKCARERKARRSAEAAMRRMLEEKKQKMQRLDPTRMLEQTEDERRRGQREERARLARLRAIEELKQKRELEKQEVRRKAEEDVELLKASGRLAHSTGSALKSKARVAGGGALVASCHGTTTAASASHLKESSRQDAEKLDGSTGGFQWANRQAADWRDQADVTAGSHEVFDMQSSDGPQTERSEASGMSMASSAGGGAVSDAPTRTTLQDLMSTLKLLEEEEQLPSAASRPKPAWGEDDEVKEVDDSRGLSEERLRRLDAATSAAALGTAAAAAEHSKAIHSSTLTDAKMRNILSFLDEVDSSTRLDDIDTRVEKVTVSFPDSLPSLVLPSATDMAQMEQASQAASEVANAVITQRLELDEKNRSVQMLQKALNQQRELTIRHAKETEKEMKKRLDVQKDEYEETIKRHLSFIDQLIDDKKTLSEKCEQMVKDCKLMEKKYVERIKTLEDNHSVELAKMKEVMAASEKLKREKWIEEKTKKIKEMTVKGLEPEIQRLISKHKSELKQLRGVHEAELLQSDERAGQRYVQMTEELRDQLAKEKEAVCQREREAAAQRYEKQLQAEEEAYQQQRRRLFAEVQEEKERLAQQASRQRSEMDKAQRQMEESHAYAAVAMKAEYDKAREEQERRHAADLRDLKERQAAEKEAWEQNMLKKQEAWLLQRERELKEQVRRERDKEIELVITRLEEDTMTGREESERAAENRIKRVRDKYESEMAELEKSEKEAGEKYAESKSRLVDVTAELERCRALLKQKDREVDDVKKMSEKLYRERDQVQDVVRQEFADRMVATEEENRRVKQEMAELKSKHKLEIERMKMEVEMAQKSKEEEMEEVHKRVKQAIVKKEEVVTQLKQQYQAAVKRADHLEGLLEQQRKQILGGKK